MRIITLSTCIMALSAYAGAMTEESSFSLDSQEIDFEQAQDMIHQGIQIFNPFDDKRLENTIVTYMTDGPPLDDLNIEMEVYNIVNCVVKRITHENSTLSPEKLLGPMSKSRLRLLLSEFTITSHPCTISEQTPQNPHHSYSSDSKLTTLIKSFKNALVILKQWNTFEYNACRQAILQYEGLIKQVADPILTARMTESLFKALEINCKKTDIPQIMTTKRKRRWRMLQLCSGNPKLLAALSQHLYQSSPITAHHDFFALVEMPMPLHHAEEYAAAIKPIITELVATHHANLLGIRNCTRLFSAGNLLALEATFNTEKRINKNRSYMYHLQDEACRELSRVRSKTKQLQLLKIINLINQYLPSERDWRTKNSL